jgi:hypothetical protein
MKGYWVTCALVTLALASPARAQTAGTDEHETAPLKRIEVGTGISGLYVGGGDFGGGNGLAGVQVRVNLSRRFAVETTGNVYLGDFIHGFDYTGPRGGWDQPSHVSIPLYGIYGVQVHQSFEPRGRVTPFLMYGGTGWFEYERVGELRIPYGTGDTVVYPASSRRTVVPPVIPTAGGGVRVKLARAVFLETGAHAIVLIPFTVGIAASASVMVPIGRWR